MAFKYTNFFLFLLPLFAAAAQEVVVNPDGTGNFTTIMSAVSAIPANTNSSTFFVIRIAKGVYEEYVIVPENRTYLKMIGAGIGSTIITGNHNFKDHLKTSDSATFAVYGPMFVAINITFRNTPGPIKEQAVAVRNDANLSVFYLCSFEGYQDTLLTNKGFQFYRECDIYGTIDIIFGFAKVILQNSKIYARQPIQGQSNVITADGRKYPNDETGLIFHNCTILAAQDLVRSAFAVKTYLGRPWGQYSRTAYLQSFMDSLIDPSGWLEMADRARINTIYYAEFGNRGPGSSFSERVRWPGYHQLNISEATKFTVANFIGGDRWLPMTGVPYHSSLL